MNKSVTLADDWQVRLDCFTLDWTFVVKRQSVTLALNQRRSLAGLVV